MRILFRMINESMFVKDDQEDSMISTPLMAGSLKYKNMLFKNIPNSRYHIIYMASSRWNPQLKIMKF